MRWIIRTAVVAALLLGPAAGLASAVTIEDLLALRANGLSDDVLVALIQTDGSSFQLEAPDVIALHDAGISERVLIAMLKTSPTTRRPAVATTEVKLPIAPITVEQTVIQHVDAPPAEPTTIFVPVAVPVAVSSDRIHDGVRGRSESRSTTYWGYGGQLRPDAWQPAHVPSVKPRDEHPAARTSTERPGEQSPSSDRGHDSPASSSSSRSRR